MSVQPLRIIEINVGSLISKQKRHDMAILLKVNKPDIVLINETVLNDSHNVEFSSYAFNRTNKVPNSPGRGTGILIKSSLKKSTQPFFMGIHRINCNPGKDNKKIQYS